MEHDAPCCELCGRPSVATEIWLADEQRWEYRCRPCLEERRDDLYRR